MRKQIVFEQNSPDSCLVNIRNIFGFSINYVQDKIKKHEGNWDMQSRKFVVPLSQVPELTKQLQLIDRSFYIEQIPTSVSEMCQRYSLSSGSHKVKKQILIDTNIAKRYQYIQENVLKSILVNCKEKSLYQSKNYNKILIVTPEWKIPTWIEMLEQYKVKRVKFENKEKDQCLKQQCIWILSYQMLWNKCEEIQKYCFQTFIVDQAEALAMKIASQNQPAISFKKSLLNRHFVFFIMSKMHLNRLEILLPLFSIVMPQTNLSWMSRRYRKQNLIQLNYIIKTCSLVRDINATKPNKSQNCRHFFSKFYLSLTEQAADKIKSINKKNSQLEHKRILQSPANVRNKTERSYLQSINEVFRQEKQESINKLVSYYCVDLNLRLALIIQSSSAYRSSQIPYCHYQHPASVLQFNKNPSISVILLKWQHIQSVQFSQHSSSSLNQKLQNYQPEQYLCISGVRHLIMVDVQWGMGSDVKKREEKYWQIFRYSAGFDHQGGSNWDIVRHYFIIKNTYQQKWMNMLEQNIIKVQMNLKMKEDIRQQQEQQQLQDDAIQGCNDPAFGFCQLSLAKVQEQYSHLKIIKGVTDIDDQFDKLEYEALQQKIKRESRKKMKQQKAREKEKEFASQMEQQHQNLLKKQQSIKITEDLKQLHVHEVSSEEEYEIFLHQQKPESIKSKSSVYQQPKQVSIYEPVEPNKVILQLKTAQQSKQDCASPLQQPSSELRKEEQQKQQSQQQKQPIFPIQFKQDETEQIQIIEVRKPTKKPKVPKPKSQVMSVILRPWPLA